MATTMREINPYKELFLSLKEAHSHLRANGDRPCMPEFAEIWADVVDKYESAEAFFVVDEGAELGLWDLDGLELE